MTHPEYQYLKLIHRILKDGKGKKTRGIHGVRSVFGAQMRFDLRYGFPLLTTKKMPFKTLRRELLWFISGRTNIDYLNKFGIHYWDGFADKNGDLGPVYGYQWRKWPKFTEVGKKNGEPIYKMEHLDQLQIAIDEIINTPDSKAMMVTAHNPAYLKEMRLPPCHAFFQFNVTKGKLRLQLYQRSSDVFLGLPFNIAQYALILMMVGQITGYEARELVVTIGDGHIYYNHFEAAKKQLKRKPFKFPTVELDPTIKNIDDFKRKHIKLKGYESHSSLKAPLVII